MSEWEYHFFGPLYYRIAKADKTGYEYRCSSPEAARFLTDALNTRATTDKVVISRECAEHLKDALVTSMEIDPQEEDNAFYSELQQSLEDKE